jgi:hypothetical protein
VALLVDEARWPWRGRLWAHLVSDTSRSELHDFAKRAGLRYLSFGLDHYDVSEAGRARVVRLGATPVSSRVVVHELRRSGLRVVGGRLARTWRLVADMEDDDHLRAEVGHDLRHGRGTVDGSSIADAVGDLHARLGRAGAVVQRTAVFERPGEVLALVSGVGFDDAAPAGAGSRRRTDRRQPDHLRRTAEQGHDYIELIWSDHLKRYGARR